MREILKIIFLISITAASSFAFADEVDEIETLFKEEGSGAERSVKRDYQRVQRERESRKKKISKLENLNELKTFEDVAVIQKRYLPKTERLEFSFGAATNINDDYFTAYGLNGSLGYHFSERFGLELGIKWFDISNSKSANSLLEQNIVTDGMVGTELYYGLALRWTPIYGKFSYFDRKIIPFDHYFAIGIGQTQSRTGASSTSSINVREADETPMTLQLSTGQIFALTKWMAFRWDVSFHLYENTSPFVTNISTSTTTGGTKSLFNNMFLSFGLSFFFPEAKYR